MKAIIITGTGGPEVLEISEMPEAEPERRARESAGPGRSGSEFAGLNPG